MVSEWQTVDRDGIPALFRRCEFNGFAPVSRLIHELIGLAEEHDHHPDIRFGYSYCEIYWTTHSQGGIGPLDREMASKTDEIIAQLP